MTSIARNVPTGNSLNVTPLSTHPCFTSRVELTIPGAMKPIGETAIARFLSSPFILAYSSSISAVTVARESASAVTATSTSRSWCAR